MKKQTKENQFYHPAAANDVSKKVGAMSDD